MKRSVAASVVAFAVGFVAHGAEWEIDAVHSSALFKVNHLGASNFYGSMPDISGTINFDESNPGASSVEITIKPESVVTHNPGRDNHLKGPDFFNAKQFPVMTFKSSKWEKAEGGGYSVTGDFMMLGKTKTITIDVHQVGYGKNRRGADLTGFETEFVIDRTDFGMNYGVADSGGLGKDVTLIISVEAAKQ